MLQPSTVCWTSSAMKETTSTATTASSSSNLVDGPWILQTLVPNRPALTGTKLTQHYFRRSNYFELDLDVASSTTAQYIGAMCQSWATYLQMHLFITLQGETEDELQERILGGVDVSYLNLELATEFS